ncbi:DUF1254 domain-containing protein [Falsiphaeobacter marinintestinus]|uniref:DUF1254 domain-containing protein n=1 Tax=Falsiphaeobacter marinintestinus TaxID=1492905 RepID=UPI0016450AC1|nr:DUF1254 domain-containing protein [Phaeobacter marinintestinus]
MKTFPLIRTTTAGLLATALAIPVQAQQSQGFFDMATSEPTYSSGDFKPAPETITTRFGVLDFPGGYPTEETAQKVFDELDLQRATQLYLDMYPALSAHGLMKGWVRDLGMEDSSHIRVTADRLDSSALVLTGNTESLYAFAVFDLKRDGPTVFEVPAGVMGPLDDHNFLFGADIGPTGMDKGMGGKYLLLPPGYKGEVPDGYFIVRSPTYMNFSFIRANAATVGFGEKAVAFFREGAKIYPLKDGPRPPVVKNVTNVAWNSLVPEDASAFAWMHEMISYEPAEAFGKELLGRLASLGITQDAPFAPDARMQKIFEQAAQEGVAMSRVISFESRQPDAVVYPGLKWESPFIGDSSTFDPNGYFNLEARTTFHFTADGITPAMAMEMPEGTGSRYQTTYKDGSGNYLDGSKTYKLTMPPNVPVALFWAVTLYDPWTRSELQSRPYPSISSQQTPTPKANADGSVDLYFAAEKPADIPEQNWVPTLPDRGFFAYIRYYGPLKAFNDKTWVPNDVALIE